MNIEDEPDTIWEDSSSSSEEDSTEAHYGELVKYNEPVPLEIYVQTCLRTRFEPEMTENLRQYVVTQTGGTHPQFFAVANSNGTEYFAKYDVGEFYETEKRSHEVLDPLNCPSIIKVADIIPNIGEGGIIITPLYERYEHRMLTSCVKTVMKQLLEALRVCHDNGIAHCDIKPSNIVWEWADTNHTSVHIYLADFALACSDFTPYKNKTITEIPGTPSYSSPEKIRGDIPPDPRVFDIFAAGICFFELMQDARWHAYCQGTVEDVSAIIEKYGLFRLLWPSTLDLLKKMLAIDYKARITVNEALQHEFFKDPNPSHRRSIWSK